MSCFFASSFCCCDDVLYILFVSLNSNQLSSGLNTRSLGSYYIFGPVIFLASEYVEQWKLVSTEVYIALSTLECLERKLTALNKGLA